MDNRFANRVAIVTGGASGIGAAIAQRIAAEGGQVVIFDRETSGLDGANNFTPMQVDIANEEAVKTAIQRVVEQFGRLDILVNSAGIVGFTSTKIVDYRSEDFLQVLQINLVGSYYVTKYAIPAMEKNNYGRILLLSSMAGKEGNPGMVGYSTSKAGVIGLVKAIGKEYAETGITINGMAPAVIRTPMNEKTSPQQLAYLTERIPMKRLGTVDEVASMAC